MGSVPSSATYFRLNVANLLISLNLHLIYEVGITLMPTYQYCWEDLMQCV